VRNGGTNGDPVLRGMFGSRLNILTNGGMMLGACPGRMDAPTSYISPETYDKLTVIKGPQTVLWGPARRPAPSFEREPEHFGELGTRVNASVLAGSNGRFDKVVDAAAGGPLGYVRVIGNRRTPTTTGRQQRHRAVALRQVERRRRRRLDPGRRHPARTHRRQGRRRSALRRARHGRLAVPARKPGPALRNPTSATLDKLEAQVYYNYADHVMDNYTLRTPSGTGMMAGPWPPTSTAAPSARASRPPGAGPMCS
jgi:iron complex outermembrane receptor protein